MRKNGFLPLLGIMALVGIALVATIAAGFRPLLGIDLTGGVEVVLVAVDNPDQPDGPTNEDLDQAVEILRNRVDALAVAQPDITRQGDRIVVQLKAENDIQKAIALNMDYIRAETLADEIHWSEVDSKEEVILDDGQTIWMTLKKVNR